MNKIITIAILVMSYIQGYAQWYPINFHADAKESMTVVDEDSVFYTTGDGGRIHLVSSSSSFFQTQFTTEWFLDIEFPSHRVGYACGGTNFGSHTNVIVKSTDSGVTWDSITSNGFNGYTFSEVEFFNPDTGFVNGEGVLLRTLDGFQTISQINLPSIISPTTELYCTTTRLFLCSRRLIDNPTDTYSYSINVSDDLGDTWILTYSDTMVNANGINNRQINSIHFINDNTGFAVGGNGLFLKTTDAGATWQRSFISPNSALNTVWFTSQLVGYINNVGGIYKTTDGGLNWSAQNVASPIIFHQIQFANDSVGYALGYTGLYKTTNGGGILPTSAEEVIPEKTITIYPNPANDILQIEAHENLQMEAIELYDIAGKRVRSFVKNETTLNLRGLDSGNYVLKFSTSEGILTKKVMIQ